MKITLDTNVLISGTFWTGHSFKILDLIDKKRIKCVLSEEILKEYDKVAKSNEILEKVKNKKLVILKLVEKVIDKSTVIDPKIKINIIKEDPNDNKILECAVEGKVNYIITQDNHLLKLKEYKNIKILKPIDFLKKLKI